MTRKSNSRKIYNFKVAMETKKKTSDTIGYLMIIKYII